ncbi:MAG TPA: carbon storage regulator [Myxococcota bacterium]|nr:carbon storage regulator [Myxococcota bacterium]HND28610.1 carbon storage regulator [Myxococcota bacterium]HNH48018.1 carbon storage regulator [Myxococcota bacterium]
MLVLTLPEGEIVQIGPEVRILVSKIQGGRVTIAFDAPRNVEIQRLSPREPSPEGHGAPEVVLRPRKRGNNSR